MKIVFISNYLNHHQVPLADEMYKRCKGDYKFIATSQMSEERKNLGYQDIIDKPYLLRITDSACSHWEISKVTKSADVVIAGSAPESLIQDRIESNGLTFRYTERWFKNHPWFYPDPRIWYSLYKNHIQYRHKKLYALAASAFFANDAYKVGAYSGKIYKWGYFPDIKQYDISKLVGNKSRKKTTILWVGRFIDWKHPEAAILLAEKLKSEGYSFELKIIGNGLLEKNIKNMVEKKNLDDVVLLLGSMPPEDVRKNMEDASVFLFTSDRNEGWGAVLNESMNSGCAVVASSQIGSAPFLINDGENGLLFKANDWESLYTQTKRLIDDVKLRERVSYNAYNTIKNEWNPNVAADRFIHLAEALLCGENADIYEDGPCSKAYPI